ncbi:putative membrane protein [Rickettsia parkeri str. Tate's Hell]|uniref:Membrane protein n=1 Tax=Rickettsia parkeri str. Tate's Hell TaxID=1359189 RepID=A0ABR5DPT8_RICPA|nr:amino acid permease [Rickettsia parkeri]AFC74994.1 amino acid permease [Rickettsia parkeri str. Portsmouth]KJV95374.1 putative membrane protein [Rickettsia parkeri str. AT\
MGKYFSGHTAQIIGTVSLKLLSYALLAVFIYGGSSILQKLLALNTSITYIGAWCIITSKRNIYMGYSHSGSFYFI